MRLVFGLKQIFIPLLLFYFIQFSFYSKEKIKKRNGTISKHNNSFDTDRCEDVDEAKCLHLNLMRFKFAPHHKTSTFCHSTALMGVLLDFNPWQKCRKKCELIVESIKIVVAGTIILENRMSVEHFYNKNTKDVSTKSVPKHVFFLGHFSFLLFS